MGEAESKEVDKEWVKVHAEKTGLEEKEKLIDDIEVEIARKHTQIERKQVDIDKLNKRYEALTSGTEEENMGPLEATIHNTTKEIAKKTDDCCELKRTWMKHQTELVAVNLDSTEQ